MLEGEGEGEMGRGGMGVFVTYIFGVWECPVEVCIECSMNVLLAVSRPSPLWEASGLNHCMSAK